MVLCTVSDTRTIFAYLHLYTFASITHRWCPRRGTMHRWMDWDSRARQCPTRPKICNRTSAHSADIYRRLVPSLLTPSLGHRGPLHLLLLVVCPWLALRPSSRQYRVQGLLVIRQPSAVWTRARRKRRRGRRIESAPFRSIGDSVDGMDGRDGDSLCLGTYSLRFAVMISFTHPHVTLFSFIVSAILYQSSQLDSIKINFSWTIHQPTQLYLSIAQAPM